MGARQCRYQCGLYRIVVSFIEQGGVPWVSP
jgi:hypothetical protein